MVARFNHCEQHHLKQALAGTLPDPQAARLSQHLQSCAHCRSELEALAGSDEWWKDAKQYLSSSENTPGLSGVVTASITHASDSDLDEALELPIDFLGPSDDPTSMGKLGEYEVESIIGRGGMGIVLKARDAALNRHVAIKVLSRPLAASAAARRRFTREAQAAAAVVHENVIPIHSVGTADQTTFLVMPLVSGRSLQDRLDACGVLETQEALRIAMQTARGLAAAHAQGLVHRDVKPANILLENGVDRVRITDFGLARAVDDASQTQSGFIAGTPQYMAPEQARGEAIDARADLFSLGSVIYAMCTGHPPFRAETTLAVLRRICDDVPRDVRQSNAAVPAWLAAIIDRLLNKNPEGRYASASEVATLCERWLAHLQQPTIIPPPEPLDPNSRFWTRQRTTLVLSSVAVVAVSLVTSSAWHFIQANLESFNQGKVPVVEDAASTRPSPSSSSQPDFVDSSVSSRAYFERRELDGRRIDQELETLQRELLVLERPEPAYAPNPAPEITGEVSELDAQLNSLEQRMNFRPLQQK